MTTQRGTVNKFLSTSALTLGLIASASATANAMDANTTPTGEQIVAGSATMDRPDASTLNINQNTDRVVINWDSFNIGSNAKTEFFQPNSGSLAVNRVTGRNSDPTQILGTLKANGRVMVLDRNGVVFGAGSRVDVGGIVASTGDVNDAAVMRGDTKLELSNFGDASIVNNGTISVTGAGLAALVAPHVANNGVIEARLGKIALAAGGERATVDLYGDGLVEIAVGGAKGKALAENAGVLSGATVLITAQGAKEVVDTVINMSGVVQATSATVSGGKIILDGGNAGKVKVSGTIDASGAAGGGDIKVTGEDIEVTNTAFVTADATNTGNGGSIYFMGGNNAIYSGNFAARGGLNGGNGGFVELSAKNALGYDGAVTTMAVNGLAGSFLLDPEFAIIHSGWLDPISWYDLIIKAENLADDMHRNGTVTVQANQFIDVGTDLPFFGNGDINLATYDYKVYDYPVLCALFGICSGTTYSGSANPGNLILDAATVNFNKNLIMGTGTLTVLADTVNLNGQIKGTMNGGVTTTLLDQSRISSLATTVNVLSNAARIQQGVYLSANGGTVNVGNGTYNENVIVNKSLTLQSKNGSGVTTIAGLAGAGQNATLTVASGLADVTVGALGKGFTLKGFSGGDAVVLVQNDTHNVKINNNTITGNGADVGVLVAAGASGSGSSATKVLNNIIEGTDSDGVRVLGGSFAEVDGNVIRHVGGRGIYAKGHSFIGVDGNTIDYTGGDAIHVDGSGIISGVLSSTNAIIANNKIGTLGGLNNVSGYGVFLQNAHGSKVEGNTIRDVVMGGVRADQTRTLNISTNGITDSGLSGIWIVNGRDATVNGNTVTGAGAAGIELLGVSGTNAVGNNIIDGTGVDGVYANNVTGLTVSKNTITDTTGDGIETIATHNAVIAGNTLDDIDGNAIFVTGSNNVRIGGATVADKNTVNSARLDGVKLEGGNKAVVQGNSINNTGRVGIYSNNATNLLVDGNVLRHTTFDIGLPYGAVTIENGANATVSKNDISDSTQGVRMMWVNGTNKISGNTRIDKLTDDGIHVESVTGLTIDRNTVGSADATLKVNGVGVNVANAGGVKVQDNIVKSVGRDGVIIQSSDNADIFRNTISGSGGYTGVKVEGSSHAEVGAASFFSYRGNTITNFDNGVTVTGGNDNDVVRNTISGVDYGVRLSGATNSDVLDNDLTGNSIVGIEVVAGSHNAVIDNNTLDHFDTGIVVNGSNNVDVTNNDLTDVGSGIVADASNGLRVTGNDLMGRYNGGTAISVTNSDDVVIGGGTVLIFPVGVNSAEGFRDGIYANNVGNLHIRQNDLTGYGRGVGIDVRNSDGAIIGGTSGLAVYGSNVDGYNNGIRVIGSDGVEITQNDIANSVNNGIIVRHSDDAVVSENTVTFTGNDAITVNGSRDAVVNGNFALFFGGDGIVARNSGNIEIANNIVGLGWGNGIAVDGGNKAHIHNNLVGLLGGDGIVVAGAGNSLIENNLVALVGGNGVTLMPGSGINDFSDGSKVRNNTIMFVGGNGVDSYATYGVVVDGNVITNVAGNGVNVEISEDTQITNNIVDGFGGHGIAVDDENAFVDIAFNTIQNGSGDAINVRDSENVLIRRNLINNVGSDGIDVANSDMVDIRRNVIDNVGADGIDVSDSDIVKIRRNTISNVGDNGIEADDNRRVRIARNDISNTANNGIMIDENNRVRIVSNLITNSGNAGLYAAGADNGVVILEDNVFTGNLIGAWFESGIIDLTGATNTFNGGDIGMRFAPVGNPNDLTLVGNTIGTTTFNGQAQYYIELANAAFFAPGLPTILNGLNASYDGFVPNSVGGILTQAQFDAIESKIYHFNDDGSLGLFFFGAVPGIDDEDVYNRFGDLSWAGGRFRMTILGLPSVPGAGTNRVGANSPAGQPGFTGNVAEFLANLAPAAGGDDQQEQRGQSVSIAGQLADLEPAAGGDGGEVSCWSDAMNQAAGGGAVSYSFGGSMEESLSQAASCGGAI